MEKHSTDWDKMLTEFREITKSDFSAVAQMDHSIHRIRWLAASGQTNEKYRNMLIRPGKGIAGEVIRFGRAVKRRYVGKPFDHNTTDFIALAEKLQVALAVPLTEHSKVTGAILVGRRNDAEYEDHEAEFLLAAVIQESQPKS